MPASLGHVVPLVRVLRKDVAVGVCVPHHKRTQHETCFKLSFVPPRSMARNALHAPFPAERFWVNICHRTLRGFIALIRDSRIIARLSRRIIAPVIRDVRRCSNLSLFHRNESSQIRSIKTGSSVERDFPTKCPLPHVPSSPRMMT